MSAYPACKHGWNDPNFDCVECQRELNEVPFDRIKKLERERDDARKEIETLETRHSAAMLHTQGVVDENMALLAELERLKADKARLDWLCDPAKVYAICIQTQPSGETIHGPIREAIDSAMKGDK